MLKDGVLDFFQLDSESAHFHLAIGAPGKFRLAIGEIPGKVARPIKTISLVTGIGVWNEPTSGLIGPVEITPRQSVTANVQPADRSDRNGPHEFIENVAARIAHRPAYRQSNSASLAGHDVIRREHGRFGRTIDVYQYVGRRGLDHRFSPVGINRFASIDDPAKSGKGRGIMARHSSEQSGSQIEDAYLLAAQVLDELDRREQNISRNDTQARSARKCSPNFKTRGIECGVRSVGHNVRRLNGEIVEIVYEPDQIPMSDRDAFGIAGRTRRVHYISESLGMQRAPGKLAVVKRI